MAYVSLDSDQIKKAHKKHKYTKEQVEKLEKCMDPKTGPLYFMKEFMKIDRAKHTVLPPTKFGLIQITRQRVRPEMDIKTAEKCPCCNGSGETQASVLLIDEIQNNLRYIYQNLNIKKVSLVVHPFIEAHLTKGLLSVQKKWYMKY